MSITIDDTDLRAAKERHRARIRRFIYPTDHGDVRWRERGDPDLDPTDAWEASDPVHYPGAFDGKVARYHQETDTILLCGGYALVTVIELSDRSEREQRCVRQQVIDE